MEHRHVLLCPAGEYFSLSFSFLNCNLFLNKSHTGRTEMKEVHIRVTQLMSHGTGQASFLTSSKCLEAHPCVHRTPVYTTDKRRTALLQEGVTRPTCLVSLVQKHVLFQLWAPRHYTGHSSKSVDTHGSARSPNASTGHGATWNILEGQIFGW